MCPDNIVSTSSYFQCVCIIKSFTHICYTMLHIAHLIAIWYHNSTFITQYDDRMPSEVPAVLMKKEAAWQLIFAYWYRGQHSWSVVVGMLVGEWSRPVSPDCRGRRPLLGTLLGTSSAFQSDQLLAEHAAYYFFSRPREATGLGRGRAKTDQDNVTAQPIHIFRDCLDNF